MKGRSYEHFLEDMLGAIKNIDDYIKGMDQRAFIKDKKTIDVVIRNLEVIGEAAKYIPSSVRKEHPSIPWKKIVGLRNIVIHEYFGLDLKNIWAIVKKNIPAVKPELSRILQALKRKSSDDE